MNIREFLKSWFLSVVLLLMVGQYLIDLLILGYPKENALAQPILVAILLTIVAHRVMAQEGSWDHIMNAIIPWSMYCILAAIIGVNVFVGSVVGGVYILILGTYGAVHWAVLLQRHVIGTLEPRWWLAYGLPGVAVGLCGLSEAIGLERLNAVGLLAGLWAGHILMARASFRPRTVLSV